MYAQRLAPLGVAGKVLGKAVGQAAQVNQRRARVYQALAALRTAGAFVRKLDLHDATTKRQYAAMVDAARSGNRRAGALLKLLAIARKAWSTHPQLMQGATTARGAVAGAWPPERVIFAANRQRPQPGPAWPGVPPHPAAAPPSTTPGAPAYATSPAYPGAPTYAPSAPYPTAASYAGPPAYPTATAYAVTYAAPPPYGAAGNPATFAPPTPPLGAPTQGTAPAGGSATPFPNAGSAAPFSPPGAAAPFAPPGGVAPFPPSGTASSPVEPLIPVAPMSAVSGSEFIGDQIGKWDGLYHRPYRTSADALSTRDAYSLGADAIVRSTDKSAPWVGSRLFRRQYR